MLDINPNSKYFISLTFGYDNFFLTFNKNIINARIASSPKLITIPCRWILSSLSGKYIEASPNDNGANRNNSDVKNRYIFEECFIISLPRIMFV